MKEKTRVLLGIMLWVGVALCFMGAGISFLMNSEAEIATTEPIATSNIERVAPCDVGLDDRNLAHIERKVEQYIAKGALLFEA